MLSSLSFNQPNEINRIQQVNWSRDWNKARIILIMCFSSLFLTLSFSPGFQLFFGLRRRFYVFKLFLVYSERQCHCFIFFYLCLFSLSSCDERRISIKRLTTKPKTKTTHRFLTYGLCDWAYRACIWILMTMTRHYWTNKIIWCIRTRNKR